MEFIEISQAGQIPVTFRISCIKAVKFYPKRGGHDDAVWIYFIGEEKPMSFEGAQAEPLYCDIKKILKPKLLKL